MTVNKNVALVCIAVVMTLAMWMVPDTISAQTHKQRLLLTTYNTNSNRSQGVNQFCGSLASRSDLIKSDEVSTAASYKSQLSSQLKLNGNAFINGAIVNGTNSATNDIKSSQTAFGVFIGFFVVGLVILIIQWMCLCCCCCCPSCCPSKCCQKDENEQYTKCELYWPTIALITLLLLIIIVSAIGLSKASTFKTGISNIQCSTAIFFDDIVKGNVTLDGKSFFIGVQNLVSTMNSLSSNMNTINTSLTNLNTSLGTITTDLTTAQTNIQKVPNNVAADGNANINYNSGISVSGSTTPLPSLFNAVLGSSGNSGIIGQFYSKMASSSATLNGILAGTNGFISGSAGLSSSIGGMTSTLNNVKTQIDDLDSSLYNGLKVLQTPKTVGTLVINIIYGVALGLAALALLGVILMTFCDKYKCRYLMYFSCVILFFIGLIGFLVAIIFSIIVPVMYLFCQWMDVTITSSGFTGNTGTLISDTQVQNILSTCLVGGSGDIIGVVGGSTVNSTLNSLTTAINQTSVYNTTNLTTMINTANTNITATITAFKDGVILDVDQTDAITTLTNIANTNCQTTDSYPPSMTNTTVIGCSVSGGATVKPTTSGGTCAWADFNLLLSSTTSACKGCIDTSLMMYTYYTDIVAASGWGAVLTTKYPACTTWNGVFGNVWDNYYDIKIQAFQGIDSRWDTANTSLATVLTDISSLNTDITDVKSNLITSFQPILDPKYGLIAGLNCKIIGEDLQLMVSSICVSNFNTLYITRLLMGIVAFGILAAMWCIVCSGVRHFKHSQRKDRVSPNFFGDKASFQNTDAAFRP